MDTSDHRVAAIIANLYSKLSPKQIRKAILFGAKIPKDNFLYLDPLAVRSGGYLDEARAKETAKFLSNNPAIGDEILLQKVYCTGFFSDCYEAEARLELYKENGLAK